jgi:trk system potassium uptake protein TrkH
VVLLFKSLGRQISRILHPSSVNEVKFGGKVLKDSDVMPHLLYISVYAVLFAVSAVLCLLFGVGWQNSVAASITSISNVGPALGEMGSMGTFNCAPAAAKLLFTTDMFLGRIEIYPVLAVVAMVFDRRNR